jgi:membrane protein
MAAATAFFGLLSLIPLAALAISIFGRVVGSGRVAESSILETLHAVLPVKAAGLDNAIRSFPSPPEAGSWFVEAVSLLGLLWAGSRLFLTLEDVLTRVWSGHGRGRPLLLRNLVALAATIGAGAIFLGLLLATTAAAAIAYLAGGRMVFPVAAWIQAFGPPACAWLMFLLMYQFLPQERVQWGKAIIGAGVAAVLWELSRIVFADLVAHSAGYGKLYGSLAGTVVMTVWMYLSAIIMLLGAELSVVLQERALRPASG